MADVEIKYNNSTIASLSDSGTEVFETSGTFLTDDITVQYTKSGGGGGDTATVTFSNVDPSTDHVYYVDPNGSLQEGSVLVPFTCPSKSLITVLVKLLQPGVSVSATGATLKTTISNGSRATYQYIYLFQAN